MTDRAQRHRKREGGGARMPGARRMTRASPADTWAEPSAGPIDKSDGEAEARGRFLRLFEDGIEPHPGPGPQGGGKQRPTVYTRNLLDRIGCTFNHRSCKTITDSERKGGGDRRGYVCGVCKMKFVQHDPAASDFVYKNRRPVERTGEKKARKTELDCPLEQGASTTDARTRCIGDVAVRWHNAGGLACGETRRKYLTKVMKGVDILGLCETSWDDVREADARKMARWDPQVQADLYTGGQYKRESGSARNAGLALLVRRGSPVTGVRVRAHGDTTLQCMVVDLDVQGVGVRIMLTHGEPSSDMRLKATHYLRVARAVGKVNAEDDAAGAAGRQAIWLSDHNMVKDREADEDRGTKAGAGAHRRLVDLVESAEAELSRAGGMVDAYTATHAHGARGYTHGVRRIDRATVSPSLVGKANLPRVEGAEHVAREELEMAVHTKEGWEVRRPHHKAVDVTLRFSEERRAKEGGWVVGPREGYPSEVWAQAMMAIQGQVERRVGAGLRVEGGAGTGGGGEVRLALRTTRAEERQEGWEEGARGVLEAYEKEERKRRCKRVGGLRADRDRLLKAAESCREGSSRRKELTARAKRRDWQIQKIKIELGRAEEERDRRSVWSMGKDQKATHEVLRGGGKVGVQPEVLGMTHPEKGDVTSQADIIEAFEMHMSATFNLGARGGDGEGQGGTRQGKRAKARAEEAREGARRHILGCIRAHVATHDTEEARQAMEALTVDNILSPGNLREARKQIKKGTVGGEDGFDTGFYADPEVERALETVT